MKATFPMYVLPAARIIALERLPTHEEIRDELVEWREGMTTLFVSQTWLSNAHPDNADIQHYACDALYMLAYNIPNEIRIAEAGGIEAVFAALRAHPRNADVQHSGCCALANLARNAENKLRIAQAGGIDAAIDSLRVLGHRQYVAQRLRRALDLVDVPR